MPAKTLRLLALLAIAGCTSLGPRTIVNDRFDYIQALRQSWKEEMLSNIIGLRYSELPVFVQVTSVINQYKLEGELSGFVEEDNQGLGVRATVADQPTITYVPLAGEAFARNLLTPVAPGAVMSLLQGGWPASLAFRSIVRSINGISAVTGNPDEPRFLEIVALMQHIQDTLGIGIKVMQKADDQVVLILLPSVVGAGAGPEARRLHELLQLPEGVSEFKLVYGQEPTAPDEIAILTRSTLDLLIELSLHADVPEDDVATGRTRATLSSAVVEGLTDPLIRIHCAEERPDDCFVTVRYRDHWYWVDDHDRTSKRAFSFAMLVMSLTSGGATGAGPVVTVSTGG